ncbi:Vesicular-fusion protein sec18 [Fusarium oxysporum f. sp. albedinis]|nr:Vesicular-fusion protein sec18 [Fusarium oxysporum f. sp. albedinis]
MFQHHKKSITSMPSHYTHLITRSHITPPRVSLFSQDIQHNHHYNQQHLGHKARSWASFFFVYFARFIYGVFSYPGF